LSKEYNTKVYLKETYATLAHKINNTIGQILLANVWVKLVLSLKLGLDSGVATTTVCALMGLQCIVYGRS
jgi:tryptophan synthase beta subunit